MVGYPAADTSTRSVLSLGATPVTTNVVVFAPAGMVTVAGTVRRVTSAPESVTARATVVSPPVRVSVAVAVSPAFTLTGLAVTDSPLTLTFTVCDTAAVPLCATRLAVVLPPTPVTGTRTRSTPAAKVAVAGTVNTVTSLLKSCTVRAAPICVGVRVSVTGLTSPTATVTLPAAVPLAAPFSVRFAAATLTLSVSFPPAW